ncbi:hypothetical protein CJU89_6397 [Yarrowia sp. B02]|nr:hypothetical protein CJU89_6397 [Yarrowia sp. B02]
MLFKSFTALTAATAAFAAPTPQTNSSRLTLRLSPSAGAMGMAPLQVRENKVVFGLNRNNETVYPLQISVEDKRLAVVSPSEAPGDLTVASNGQLVITPPSNISTNATVGWSIGGADSFVLELYYKGSEEFYSCTSEEGAAVGGQEVYFLNSGEYQCEEPFKFTLGVTGQQFNK